MATPFGSYRGGYQALPQNWLPTMTQVGENYAQGIREVTPVLTKGIGQLYKFLGVTKDPQEEADKQQLPTNMAQYEQIAKMAGVEPDPSLLERFSNRGQMSGQEASLLNKSLQDATNQALLIDELRRKQQAFQMQQSAAQQAMQRSMQSQGLQDRRTAILRTAGSVPFESSQMSMPAPQPQTAIPRSMININPSTLMPYGGMTINQPVRF